MGGSRRCVEIIRLAEKENDLGVDLLSGHFRAPWAIMIYKCAHTIAVACRSSPFGQVPRGRQTLDRGSCGRIETIHRRPRISRPVGSPGFGRA
jgi:hypothetical protein